MGSPSAKTRERIYTIYGSKCVKSAKDVPFGGFDQKFFTHPLLALKIQKFCITKSIFRSKKAQFVVELEMTHGDFKFGVKNLTGNRIMAVSTHAQQKIG